MPKSLMLGNGNILVGLDNHGEVKDFYFPYVGLENQLGVENSHKVGIFVDGDLSWLSSGQWEVTVESATETLGSRIIAKNPKQLIELHFNDVVYNEKNIFIRNVVVKNLSDRKREVKIYFYQQFLLYESEVGNTAYFDPIRHFVIHYKGQRVFLVNAFVDNKGFDDYCIGNFGVDGKEGSYRDAEDGALAKNSIEHGKVDSIIGLTLDLETQQEKTVSYWLAVGKSIREVNELNAYVIGKTPPYLIKTTQDFWHAWINNKNFNFDGLDPKIVALFKKSLLTIRAHADDNGGIIASGDSDMLKAGKDTYLYVWQRDSAYSALALDRAGDYNVAERFFEFSNDVISQDGFFMHKYRPDKSLGSSWHPWIQNGRSALPIQEDETAIVVYTLWKHYELSRDLEFVERIYNTLIKRAADFMISYTDPATGLSLPSYDLWEEKYGIHTYTCAVKYGALVAAGKFARKLGKADHELRYNEAAELLREGIVNYLYSSEKKMFYKMVNYINGELVADETIDISSIYGIYNFRVLDIFDPRVKESINTIEEKLRIHTDVDGIPRYENDRYFRLQSAEKPNPWFITTLWYAQYYIASAQNEADLEKAMKWIMWCEKYALASGVLSEQINAYAGFQISAAPLTWSHAEFVNTVILYLNRLEELGIIDEAVVQETV